MSEPIRRLHWLMYGLFYPGILGAVGVFALLKLEDGLLGVDVLAVAFTAGAFFSLSFASAFEKDKDYKIEAFACDVIEIVGIWACFALLKIVEPLPHYDWLQHHEPRLWLAYIVLAGILIAQIAWREYMQLNPWALIDLKVTLIALMAIGMVWISRLTRESALGIL